MYNITIIKDKEKQKQMNLKNKLKVQITIYKRMKIIYNINIIKVRNEEVNHYERS